MRTMGHHTLDAGQLLRLAFDCIVLILSMFSMKTSCSKPVSHPRLQQFLTNKAIFLFSVG